MISERDAQIFQMRQRVSIYFCFCGLLPECDDLWATPGSRLGCVDCSVLRSSVYSGLWPIAW